MKLLVAFLFISGCGFADSLVCQNTSGPAPVAVSCEDAGYLITRISNRYVIGNMIYAQDTFEADAPTYIAAPFSSTISYDQVAIGALPIGPTGDYYIISENYYAVSYKNNLEFGQGIDAGVDESVTGVTDSDLECVAERECFTPPGGITVSANQPIEFSYTLSVGGSVVQGSNWGAIGSAAASYEIDRFHADGTPDPFSTAPEPTSIALSLCGFVALGFFKEGFALPAKYAATQQKQPLKPR